MKYAILTLNGKDRPGINSTAANFLKERSADIMEEQGYVMNDDYSVASFVFSAPDEWMKKIDDESKTVLKHFNPKLCATTLPHEQTDRPIEYQLDVFAPDEPGIIAAIERSIAAADINIVGVKGKSRVIPGIPSKIYNSTFELRVPSAQSIRQLREDIYSFESERCWDIDLHPVQVVAKPKYIAVEKAYVQADSEMPSERWSPF